MTHSPTTNVGLLPLAARLPARRWENTAPPIPRGEPQRLSAGRITRRIAAAVLGALALAGLRCALRRRVPTPSIQRLATADDLKFALLCHQFTHARHGVEQ
ncbi:hypothetical protein ACFQ0X_22180 [Streptomyces rectiviolaceus]|uniref:Uncharacterized protein n=1 Tax=Streptomyces rectiviolaceus TaxID=332591 RepID=A0ABP6M6K6_9ACTN